MIQIVTMANILYIAEQNYTPVGVSVDMQETIDATSPLQGMRARIPAAMERRRERKGPYDLTISKAMSKTCQLLRYGTYNVGANRVWGQLQGICPIIKVEDR